MNGLRVGEAILALMFLAGCAQVVSKVSAPDTSSRLLAMHNEFRAEKGIGPLSESLELSAAAKEYCQELSVTGARSHVGKGGTTPGSRARAAGYDWKAVAENLGFGYDGPESAMAGWRGSHSHAENALNPKYSQAGFASCQPGNLWVVMFASPRK